MKKILAIIASPRKLGNCEIMVKEISQKLSQPHELEMIRLSDFQIEPCQACYTCLFKDKCVIDDDFHIIAQAMAEADALIVAAPTYFLGPNASLKRFIDRGLALYAQTERMWAKPAIGVGVAGIPGKEGYTRLGIESFLKLIMADVKATRMVYGALPGEIFFNDDNQKTAADLAAALEGKVFAPTGPSCPLCGGQTFRFLKKNQVQCMLCSNYGSILLQEDEPIFKIEKSCHELFLSLEDALAHKKWLLSMKSRFMENKDALKKISLKYRKHGKWIKPPQK